MANLPTITDDTFQTEVLNSPTPVLVDFGAEWCKPCKILDPIVEKLSVEWGTAVKVVTMNADVSPQTTANYGVMGLPTLILFKGGQPVERLMGFQRREQIVAKINPHLD